MATLFDPYTHAKRDKFATLTAEQQRLVEGSLNMCRALARKLCPPDDNRQRREQRIEDIEGEAMLALSLLASHFDPTGGVKFTTAAHTYVTKWLRRVIDEQRVAAMQATGVDWDTFSRVDSDDEEGEELLQGAVLDDYDRELLGRLPPDMRECVTLVILGGLTPEQVAVQIGKQPKDVKLVIRNAAKILGVEREKLDRPALFDEAE